MRVLWFTNILMPDALRHLGLPSLKSTGWWMVSLLNQLKLQNIELGVVCAKGRRTHRFQVDGVNYFIVPTPMRRAILSRIGSSNWCKPVKKQIDAFAQIVRIWKPDVIHIHGTEKDYGLVRAWGKTNVPTMVSIQGLIQVTRKKIFGELQNYEIYGRLPLKLQTLTKRQSQYEAYTPIEKDILRGVDMVVGRTAWDQAWAWSCNPKVVYRHVDEIMRDEFYETGPWELKTCRRLQIFTTSGDNPMKGIHVLIEAIRFLKQAIPDIKLKIGSNGFGVKPHTSFGRYIRSLIQNYQLERNVEFLGWLNDKQIVQHLLQSNCFVTPSFIENGCNALQEAMLVGLPCVASNAGGLTTTLAKPNSGLSFPSGDAAMLAICIRNILECDSLAVELGQNARKIAQGRHNREKVVKQNMDCYRMLKSMGSTALGDSKT